MKLGRSDTAADSLAATVLASTTPAGVRSSPDAEPTATGEAAAGTDTDAGSKALAHADTNHDAHADTNDDAGAGSTAGGAPSTDPGRRRRRLALLVVAVAVLSALGGSYVGTRLRSPADAAADRAAPIASRITVPVVRQALSSTLTLGGEIQYAEPFVVRLSGSVGLGDGDSSVVTRVPALDADVAEGDAIVDVSGRPVFVLEGSAPMYRSLAPGSIGADVLAVEQALDRLGFSPGTVDTTYDAATETAIDAFYLSRGYASVGPSPTELDQLRQLRDAVGAAEQSLAQANAALLAASQQPHGAELLALQQSVQSARDAVPRTQATAQRNNDTAAQAVTAATTARDTATTKRNTAKTKLDAVSAAGAISPDTQAPYTATEIAAFQSDFADADAALAAAELELANAVSNQAAVYEQGKADVVGATNAKVLAEAQLADATKPPDTTAAQQAVTDAQAALDRANQEHANADARIGTRLPSGEIVFVPALPSTVTTVTATVGGATSGDLLTLSSSATSVVGKVGKADSDLVVVGAHVSIELRDFDIVLPGTVTFVGQPPAGADDGDGSGSSGGSGRLQVVVQPDDPDAVTDYVFSSVRILIEVASTGGEVLVVPVAAVSIGGDGSSRVEVERAPVTEDDPGATDMVPIEVGLTAQGLVEVRPLGGATLAEGDRVVVGADASDDGESAP